jgi:hypothetical protein
MFAVIYRWRVHPEKRDDFETGWRLVSEAVMERYGSLGSRLHVAEDGTYLSYGRWYVPEDRLPYRQHLDFHPEGWGLMQSAVLEEYPEIRMTVVGDLLNEPPDSLPGPAGKPAR